jgi:hypothetical protein
VIIVHHPVMQFGNSNINLKFVRCSIEFSWPRRVLRLRILQRGAAQPRQKERRLGPAKEAAMELRTRLNVLAAIISFAFLTAVVFGMF